MFSYFRNILYYKSSEKYTISHLIFGIGNKGHEYNKTRHNIGFFIVDELLRDLPTVKTFRYFNSELFLYRFKESKYVLIAKPQTYVNRSGKPFIEIQKKYKLSLSTCLVVIDDFHLPLGTIRFKRRGSDGGHNGLKSVIAEVGNEFPRLKIGIGPKPDNCNTIEFVLGSFSTDEEKKIKEIIIKATKAIHFFCENGIDAAMNVYNK